MNGLLTNKRMKLNYNKALDNIICCQTINEIKKFENVLVFGAGQSGEWIVNLLRE